MWLRGARFQDLEAWLTILPDPSLSRSIAAQMRGTALSDPTTGCSSSRHDGHPSFSWFSGSAAISVLVQVGLALQEPGPHARASFLTVVAGTLPDGLLSPRNLSPWRPLSRSGGPLRARGQQVAQLGWMRRRPWVCRARTCFDSEAHRSMDSAPAFLLDLLCLVSWRKKDRERREV